MMDREPFGRSKRRPQRVVLSLALATTLVLTAALAVSGSSLAVNKVSRTQGAAQVGADCNNGDGSAAGCPMQAITVPGSPGDARVAHLTYSGAVITLKGIARYGGNQFMWGYGDGTSMAWTPIADPYNLGVTHVYTGAVGRLFVARLFVRNSAEPSVVATADYLIEMRAGSSLADRAQTDVRAHMAVDDALWYLHRTQVRDQFAAGQPGYSQRNGSWPEQGQFWTGTCPAVDAFELAGTLPQGNYATDPYVEDVQRGLAGILAGASVVTLPADVNGDPDTNGNHLGISLAGASQSVSQSAACAIALADSQATGRLASTGLADVYGRSYSSIAQDAVDWFAYAQNGQDNSVKGSWGYVPRQGTTGDPGAQVWPVRALQASAEKMGATIPASIRTLLPYWLVSSRHAANDRLNGGWAYDSGDHFVSAATTAGGLLGESFVGNPADHPFVKAGLGFLYRNWAYAPDPCWINNIGNLVSMYSVTEALIGAGISRVREYDPATGQQTGNSFDWYYAPTGQVQQAYGPELVQHQESDGSWQDTAGCGLSGRAGATALGSIILGKDGAPVADIGGPYSTDANMSITFDASRSFAPSGGPLTYAWDFAYDGSSFNAAPGVTGPSATFAGFPTYSQGANGAPIPGVTHLVAVRVTDSYGQSAITVTDVGVKPPPHVPLAVLAPASGPVNVPVQFDASGSHDIDGDPLTYAWDFSGSGAFSPFGARPTWTYTIPGLYPFCVQVTDHPDQNPAPYVAPSATALACGLVSIGGAAPLPQHQPPVCQIVSPNIVQSNRGGNMTFTVDGSRSSDVNGDPLTFSWSTNGGPAFADATASLARQTRNMAHAGALVSWTDTLTVNNGFFSSSCDATITVIDNLPPSLTVPGNVIFEADANASSRVNAWLAAATADDLAAGPGESVTIANDFAPNSGIGGVGVGNPVRVTWTATSPTGVTAQASATVTIVDTTPPVLTLPADITTGNSTVSYTADAVDFVDGSVPVSCSAPSGSVFSAGTTVVDCTASDTRGNRATGSFRVTVQDTTPPVVVPTVTGTLSHGWYTSTVHVTWAVTDPESAVTPTGCEPFALDTDTNSVTLICSATSAGGTNSVSVELKRDTHAPQITNSLTPVANAVGWNNTAVTAAFACSDGGSGVVTCPQAVVFGEGANQSASVSVADVAGNTAQVAVANVNVDLTPPVVDFSGPRAYAVDDVVNITCAASDGLSGLASSTCTPISGPAWSFGTGTTTRSASAVDRAGNVGTGSVSFTVGVTAASLCRVTTQFIQGSNRYATLTPAQKAAIDAVSSALCRNLLSIAPRLTPLQKRLLIAGYDAGVQALVQPGWLTASQAAALKRLAAAL